MRFAFCFLLAVFLISGCSRQVPEYTLVTAGEDVLRIPLSEVNDGRVHFYTYKFDGKNINFFVRTDGTGRLQTHFDACYSCFKYKKGYVVVGNVIVCIACRLKYDLAEEVWDFIGPCAPISLKNYLKKDFLVIKLKRLEKGKELF